MKIYDIIFSNGYIMYPTYIMNKTFLEHKIKTTEYDKLLHIAIQHDKIFSPPSNDFSALGI